MKSCERGGYENIIINDKNQKRLIGGYLRRRKCRGQWKEADGAGPNDHSVRTGRRWGAAPPQPEREMSTTLPLPTFNMPIPPSTCHYFLISRLLAYFEIPCVTWLFYSLHVLSPCPDVSFVPPLRHKLTFFHFSFKFCFNILAKFGIGSWDNINIFFKRFIIKEEMCN